MLAHLKIYKVSWCELGLQAPDSGNVFWSRLVSHSYPMQRYGKQTKPKRVRSTRPGLCIQSCRDWQNFPAAWLGRWARPVRPTAACSSFSSPPALLLLLLARVTPGRWPPTTTHKPTPPTCGRGLLPPPGMRGRQIFFQDFLCNHLIWGGSLKVAESV